MIVVGDCVVLVELPEWASQLPLDSQQVFEYCVGRTYQVVEIDKNGLCVLDVSVDVDERFGGYMNDIRVEEHYLSEVACS